MTRPNYYADHYRVAIDLYLQEIDIEFRLAWAWLFAADDAAVIERAFVAIAAEARKGRAS
jgi:hypothetical protein